MLKNIRSCYELTITTSRIFEIPDDLLRSLPAHAMTSTDEVEEKPARPEKVTAPDPLPTRTRNGIDFSGCF